MAESSIGYDVNAGILETDFATLSTFLGSGAAVVESEASRKVTSSTANPGSVDVAAGVSYAFGVRHVTDTIVNQPISSVSLSGATRWDAIVLRRNWSNNSVTVQLVQGTPSVNAPEVAPTLNATPGQVYDQLLALVQATNGSTALVVSDKRLWSTKLFTVGAVAGLPVPTAALYGAVCYVIATRTIYRCLLVSGSPAWVADAPPTTVLTGTDVISPAPGWSMSTSTQSGAPLLACRGMYNSATGLVQIDIQLRRSSGTISPYNSGGGVPASAIGTLPLSLSPDSDVDPTPFGAEYATGSGSVNSWRGAFVSLAANGTLNLHQISSDDLAPVTSGQSFRMHVTFFKRI